MVGQEHFGYAFSVIVTTTIIYGLSSESLRQTSNGFAKLTIRFGSNHFGSAYLLVRLYFWLDLFSWFHTWCVYRWPQTIEYLVTQVFLAHVISGSGGLLTLIEWWPMSNRVKNEFRINQNFGGQRIIFYMQSERTLRLVEIAACAMAICWSNQFFKKCIH